MQQLNNLLFSAINQFVGQNQFFDYLFIFFAEAMPYVFIALVVILWLRSKDQSKRYLIGAAIGCMLMGLYANWPVVEGHRYKYTRQLMIATPTKHKSSHPHR